MITFIYLVCVIWSFPQFAEFIGESSQNWVQCITSIIVTIGVWYGLAWILDVERFWDNIVIGIWGATIGSLF